MRGIVIGLAGLTLIALGACGGSSSKSDDAGPGFDGGGRDAGAASALDRPELPRPPSGGLPAELRPPTNR